MGRTTWMGVRRTISDKVNAPIGIATRSRKRQLRSSSAGP
jgi:hypothetical protein